MGVLSSVLGMSVVWLCVGVLWSLIGRAGCGIGVPCALDAQQPGTVGQFFSHLMCLPHLVWRGVWTPLDDVVLLMLSCVDRTICCCADKHAAALLGLAGGRLARLLQRAQREAPLAACESAQGLF